MKKYDVIAIGELLIDFSPAGNSALGFPVFECNPGGAPPNMLTAVSRQGGKVGFIGKVGDDSFGELLKDTLVKENIDVSHLCVDKEAKTTLAFVTLDDTGNRSFSFFRNPGADMMLTADEIDEEYIKSAKILHFGSISCTHEPSRSATKKALEIAKNHNLIISYDPNLRLPLWKNAETAKSTILDMMCYANLVKISEEEFEFLTGSNDYQANALDFMKEHNIDLLFVTLGPNGAYFRTENVSGHLPTYDVPVVDTTGSGDSFTGAVLNEISKLDKEIKYLTLEEISEIVDLGNASGSFAAMKKGGIPSIPTLQEVKNCMRNYSKVK